MTEPNAEVLRIIDDEREALGCEPRIRFDGPVDAMDERVAAELLPTIREALSNVASRFAPDGNAPKPARPKGMDEIDARANFWAVDQQKGMLAGVIGGGGRGIVAVIGGDQKQIARQQSV